MTAREDRYEKLISWGFVKKESLEFSRHNFDAPKSGPYWHTMFRNRDRQYKAYLGRGGTREGWVLKVKAMYKRKGWFMTIITNDRRKVKKLNPWSLAKAMKKGYEQKEPEWASPHIKRTRSFKKTQRRIDNELQYAEPPRS